MSRERLLGWREIPIGGIVEEPGTAVEYNTGSWRTYRPVLDKEKCINCMICWISCPDSSIKILDGKMIGFDYDHCKGCGICAEECPKKVRAITMVDET